MPKQTTRISKASMSRKERELRSRLAQLISSKQLIRGTLNPRDITCGKSNCKCFTGDKHKYLYLVSGDAGKRRQLLVARSFEARARQWVSDYQQIQTLLEELSQLYWDKLQKREE